MKKLLILFILTICMALSFGAFGCNFGGDVNLGGGNNNQDGGLGDDNEDNSNDDNTDDDNNNDNTGDDNTGDDNTGDDNTDLDIVTYGGVVYELSSNNYVVSSVALEAGQTEVVIEGEIQGKKVTKIKDEAFYNKTAITKVILPESVTEIGASAFRRCKGMLEINLDKVKTIGASAFSDCSVLANVNLASATSIGTKAFENNAKLKKVENFIAETVPVSCFSSCAILKEVQLGETVKKLDESAFSGCKLLSIIDVSKIERFESKCFNACASLKSAQMNSAYLIRQNAFMLCTTLESVLIGDNCILFYKGSFYKCDKLKYIDIPNTTGWKSMGVSATDGKTEWGPNEINHEKFGDPVLAVSYIIPATEDWDHGSYYCKKEFLDLRKQGLV